MKLKRTELGSPSTGTGVEAPKQPRLSYREMQQTSIGGSRHADGSLKQGGSISLQVVVGVKPDGPTKLAAFCKIIIVQLNWIHEEVELARK